ncbi:hypothetical protein D3C85_1422930 [compost metagenome]
MCLGREVRSNVCCSPVLASETTPGSFCIFSSNSISTRSRRCASSRSKPIFISCTVHLLYLPPTTVGAILICHQLALCLPCNSLGESGWVSQRTIWISAFVRFFRRSGSGDRRSRLLPSGLLRQPDRAYALPDRMARRGCLPSRDLPIEYRF